MLRGLAVALFGALAGPAFLVLLYAVAPAATFDMDYRVPPNATGFYPAEADGPTTFAWTSRRADISFAGLDRRSAWPCSIRFRGARPTPALPQPDLFVGVDGVTLAVRHATNEFQDLDVVIPPAPARRGAVLTLSSSTTFVPGPQDTRELGVQVDRVACAPVGSAFVLPPRHALAVAAVVAFVFGAAFGVIGITAGSAAGATAVLAAGNAVPLMSGSALYGSYPDTVVPFAAWIAVLVVVALKLGDRWQRQPCRNTARFAVVFSAVALYLKIIALTHPSKGVVDALYHVHRFEWVLSGRFYFTQVSKSLTPFPYAIGLYLVAAPWSLLTRDYMTLLRVVVCAADVLAGALLYLLIVRTWRDRLVAAAAVALFNLVPLSYTIVGNANLTNAFGQSLALMTVVAITVVTANPRRLGHLVGLTLLTTLALMCHVSVFALLMTTLLAVVVLFRWFGDRPEREAAKTVLLVSVLAVLLSTVVYYGHFGDVYKRPLERMRATVAERLSSSGPSASSTSPAVMSPTTAAPAVSTGSTVGRVYIPLHRRILNAVAQTWRNIGWPILLLGVVGAWRLWVEGPRDRLTLVLGAWGLAALVFLTVSVPGAVETRYQKDAWEFIDRVELATFPAAVILAAKGAMWGWRAGKLLRLASALLLLGAVVTGWRAWIGWVQ